jgi:hypothetical protein
MELPGVWRPAPGQTIHPVGKGLIAGWGTAASGEIILLGFETVGVGVALMLVPTPITIIGGGLVLVIGIIMVGGGVYTFMNVYNIAVSP